MRYYFPIFLLALAAYSCKQNSGTSAKPVKIGSRVFEKNRGADCDKPDTLRINCAQINYRWPVVEEGSPALKKSVAAWANYYLVGMLAIESDSINMTVMSLDSAANVFFDLHENWLKEAPDSPLGYYVAEAADTVLLNNGKYLTLQILGYTFTGGAHGNPTCVLASFDVATGKQLTWTDMVSDTAALTALAEQKFRKERADLFQSESEGGWGFEFDDIFRFKLPDNYGRSENGIYFYYTHYEVGPYAIGATEFEMTKAELGGLFKE